MFRNKWYVKDLSKEIKKKQLVRYGLKKIGTLKVKYRNCFKSQ